MPCNEQVEDSLELFLDLLPHFWHTELILAALDEIEAVCLPSHL